MERDKVIKPQAAIEPLISVPKGEASATEHTMTITGQFHEQKENIVINSILELVFSHGLS